MKRGSTDVSHAAGGWRRFGYWFRDFAKTQTADLVTVLIVLGCAFITLLSLIDVFTLTAKVFANIAIFIVSAWLIATLIDQEKRRDRARKQDETLERLNEKIATVGSEVKALGGVIGQTLGPKGIREVPGPDIDAHLNSLLKGSTHWFFRGGSGRWQRSEVLPALAERRAIRTTHVMQILDPRDADLLKRYAQYRQVSRPQAKPGGFDSSNAVLLDLLACIYAAGWYSRNTMVKCSVFLTSLYSPLRIDAGDTGIAVTVADLSAPALWASSGGWLYDSILEELQAACDELPEVVTSPDRGETIYPSDKGTVNGEHITNFLTSAAVKVRSSSELTPLWNGSPLAPEDLNSIARRAFGEDSE